MCLIDMEEAKNALVEKGQASRRHKLGETWELNCEEIFDALCSIPSTKRQVKCKDCYYWGNKIVMRDRTLGDCGNFGVMLDKDFYCAWASRREQDG